MTPQMMLPEQALAEATGRPVMITDGEGITGGFDPGENSSTCGDYSLGAEPSSWRTWALGKADEPFVRITATYFVRAQVRDEDGSHGDYLDVSDYDDAIRDRKRLDFSVECQTEFLHFSDLDDPGGSEVRCDYDYSSGSDLFYHSLADALAVATRKARGEDWDNYYPENA